ncbi:Hypothetical protein Tpal_2213 [Trichococcus palustris]|uniref:ABC transmembrane type-1 domain-containing protein n=1 Tax=Trichococcus palustris TaxID=140314 RepID=A0A143YUZ6_9LACT|nr:ABC transporter permease [Trichococcus palustris]CZQ98050.1 Hypothetical protein Tpal_2213 [Trichococcus palustris]SFL15347.1 osmoprotectant transport system permease protein [Trichococcus palustris]
MIQYALDHPDKLLNALGEHITLVMLTMLLSIVLASILTILSAYSKLIAKLVIHFFSTMYAIPSLALFAVLIPFTGLGSTTAIVGLTIYCQYILLRSFSSGINQVDPTIVEAARGMGMTPLQILYKIQLPLAKRSFLSGIRLAFTSTIGIATIAASINAGGIGVILFDGLRTMNMDKLLWGSVLSTGLALATNALILLAERKIKIIN